MSALNLVGDMDIFVSDNNGCNVLQNYLQQECIPVGCVPAARRPYAGVCFPGGGSAWSRGGLPGLGGYLIQGGGV